MIRHYFVRNISLTGFIDIKNKHWIMTLKINIFQIHMFYSFFLPGPEVSAGQ